MQNVHACQTMNLIVIPPQMIHGFVQFAYKVSKYHPFNNIASGAEFILNATGSMACITKNL